MLTRSTFNFSTAIEALIELSNTINNGYIDGLPIEQQIGSLYSGDILTNHIMSSDEGMFTDEEINFINSLKLTIQNEISNIVGVGGNEQ